AAAGENYAASARDSYNADRRELASKTDVQSKLRSVISAIDNDDYSDASPEYSGDLPSLCSRWLKAESEYSAAEEKYLSRPEEERADQTSELNNKKSAKDNAASEYENEKNRVRSSLVSQLSSVEAEISDISFRISDYESQAGSESNMSYEAADADVTAKQRALEELMTAYNKTKKTNDITDQKAALDMEAQQKALDKQREKVEKLKKNSSEDKIVSKYSGVVSSVNVKPDEKVMAGTPMAVIDIADEGFTVKIPVDGEKTKKIKNGTSADIVNNWGDDIEAVLTDIKNDTVSGSKKRTLIFSVKGDVESGTSLDLSIPCGSGQYDAIIPKSAVYEDNNGKFVLTVRSKSSPLGNRYYADRVSVDVKASDELSSAVEGNISQGTYVITNASKPVRSGDQVRIKDK
ncbi:MAG: RND transporter, partial [Ruminococcus sp.]|nr:RND transporter [Ruminococcus sp.]